MMHVELIIPIVKSNLKLQRQSQFVDSDACIVVKETKKITGTGIDAAAIRTDERNEEVIFKNFASFTDCISEINYT